MAFGSSVLAMDYGNGKTISYEWNTCELASLDNIMLDNPVDYSDFIPARDTRARWVLLFASLILNGKSNFIIKCQIQFQNSRTE